MASKGPLIDLKITRDGVENEAVWPPTPIPLGTKMRGHLKSDGSVEGAVSLTDNIFVLRLDNRYFEPDNPAHRREGACAISGGSKRKRKRKTKRRK